ncbi:atp-dependent rna helicase suv3 [Ophiostoma piceae UAMH 11346]|uniref:RNA helicase n=1 Tax=Ophiostoma piceae (strain UAMH 11346) TaxID=1262450 RepID=S3BT17_OPHP1|nr:atp-dependent rna helicase suv3 [Ophiostoma piceae UAMH 11346]
MSALLKAARVPPRCATRAFSTSPCLTRNWAEDKKRRPQYGLPSRFTGGRPMGDVLASIRRDLDDIDAADTPKTQPTLARGKTDPDHYMAHGNSSRFRPAATSTRSSYREPSDTMKYSRFGTLLNSRFAEVLKGMGPWHPGHAEYRSFGLNSQSEVDTQAHLFRNALGDCIRTARVEGLVSRSDNPLFWSLRNAFVRGDLKGLSKEIRYAFQSFVLRTLLPQASTTLQQNIADFRHPAEWYPATRTMQRVIHVHVGPTNSGKTYHALQALENAKTGIYAGPLRLLAHEIYTRFMAKGKPCALITGEEQRFPMADGTPMDPSSPASLSAVAGKGGVADSYFESCTVEMTPLNKRVDVAVIDEIQMIGDSERGWAWTQAFLGVQAREVHLCGEERTVNLIRSLCNQIGDVCHVHYYNRLSGLQTMDKSFGGDFKQLRKGDAVVGFSRIGLHSLKQDIEKATGSRCAIVYGSLPPETRAQQAALFNDPDNDYDFLVASDAIGMGLNLEIKRVIFEAATKHDGKSFRNLTVPEIKQIGGRAGRYRSAAQANKTDTSGTDGTGSTPTTRPPRDPNAKGYVTTLEEVDLEIVQNAFNVEAEPLQWAGIQPPTFAIEQFSRYFPPETPFSFILTRLNELAKVSSRFQLCTPNERIEVADIIQPYPMSVYDRCIFIASPCVIRDPAQADVLRAMARCVSEMTGGGLLDIPELDLEILDKTADTFVGGHARYLWKLESLHKGITLYLWLSYRYSGVFTSQQLAFRVKTMVEDKITEYLNSLTYVAGKRQQRLKLAREQAAKKQRITEKLILAEESDAAAEKAIEEQAAAVTN